MNRRLVSPSSRISFNSSSSQKLDASSIPDTAHFNISSAIWIPARQKSSQGGRPKKRIYQRFEELDKVMEMRKKPWLILQLKSIIQTQKQKRILLRDLEKEVGFVQKWNFMAVIEKHPSIFHVGGGDSSSNPPFVSLTNNAHSVAHEEEEVMDLMEPILVKNLRKLLMLSVEGRIRLEKIETIRTELGLPQNFKHSLIPKYPEFFLLKHVNGDAYLDLQNWDSCLAVTAREHRLAQVGIAPNLPRDDVEISIDGNFLGPFAFKMNFCVGFRPNNKFLEELERWQRLEFPSPYVNARKLDAADHKLRKRMVAVLHELLSLTMEKRLTSSQLDVFHSELSLPSRLLLFLVRHHGIFYLTNKGIRSTVFLKEGYDGSNLINKCPLTLFNDKFVSLA